MIYSVKRPYRILFGITVFLISGIILIEYSGLFKLEEVTLEGDKVISKNETPEIETGTNLFSVPLDRIADTLISQNRVFRVDIDYQLPNGINMNVNDIRPRAVVIDKNGRTKFFLTESAHLLPMSEDLERFDFPLITGLSDCRAYEKSNDDRLDIILTQLDGLKKDCIDFYLALAAIDLSDKEIIRLYVEGLPFAVETYAGGLYRTVRTLEAFLLEYNPDLKDIKKLDMRLEGMIIAAS